MLHPLIAYDAQGNIVATLDHLVAKDADGNVIGLVDFEAHEEAGGKLRGVWEVSNAVGSCVWPEWLGGAAQSFRVELDGKKAVALVHKTSGHRRVRADIEAAVAERINEKRLEAVRAGDAIRKNLRKRKMAEADVALVDDPAPEPADVRDLLGGPNRPLLLDDDGRTKKRVKAKRPNLPVVGRQKGS